MADKPEALRLAAIFDGYLPAYNYEQVATDAAAELRRLHRFELACNLWHEKTDWVQETIQPRELGMHRADVLKQRIERLQTENESLKRALAASCDEERDQLWEASPGGGCSRARSAEAQSNELRKALNNIEVSTHDAMTAALARAAIAKSEGQK